MTVDDENLQLINSLLACVNLPMATSLQQASAPFQWALDLAKERRRSLRHRVTFNAESPAQETRNLLLATNARRIARHLLWWLATTNDAALPDPVLFLKAGRPRVHRALTLEQWAEASALLEAPLAFRYFKVFGDTVTSELISLWDRPSTCIAHALDLLLTDYRGLRSRVRACPYLDVRSAGSDRADLAKWTAEQIGRDHALHFFVDARFVRGQPRYYCTPQHQRTAYMRRYRAGPSRHK